MVTPGEKHTQEGKASRKGRGERLNRKVMVLMVVRVM